MKVYKLAEIKNGTGFTKGVRFVEIDSDLRRRLLLAQMALEARYPEGGDTLNQLTELIVALG